MKGTVRWIEDVREIIETHEMYHLIVQQGRICSVTRGRGFEL